MSNESNPGIVFKLLGALLIFTTIVISVLLVFLEIELNKYHIILASVNLVGGFAMLSDRVRDSILNLADKLPFVPYKQPEV